MMMRTLRSPSRFVVLCIALLLAAGGTSVMASKGAPDRKSPKLSLRTPANGSATSDTTPRLAGKAGNAAGDRRTISVRVYPGARATGRPQRVLTARRNRASWAVNLAPALLPGTYTARARQLDASGNSGMSRSSTFTIRRAQAVAKPPVKVTPPVVKPVKPPVPPPPVVPKPAVTITFPVAGLETADRTPSFTASVADATGAVTLVLYPGSAAAGTPALTLELTSAGGVWSGEPDEDLDDGVYTAQAESVGAAGKTGRSTPVTFRVDTAPPQPVLTAPLNGAATSDGTPAFAGSAGTAAGDSTQVRVFVYAGLSDSDAPVASLTANRSGAAFSVPPTSALPVGTYTARAEQQDGAGNTGRSSPRTFAVTSTAAAATYRDTVMADAPRAYWRLGEAGGTSAADQTGFANTGAYQGSPALGQAGIVPVAQSTAIALDGSNDSVRVPSSASLNPTAALSLETWIRPAALPASTATLVRKDLQYLMRLGSGGAVTFRLWHGGATSEVTTPAGAVPAGSWSHVVATFNGTSMSIYVNGTERATLAMAAAVDVGTALLSLGASSSSDWFRGRMDEVAVYGSALPGARVLAHYTKSSPVEDPPPTVVLESPAPGSTTDLRPVFSGTADGETSTVTVKVYAGSSASGTPVQTLSATHQTSNLFSVAASSNLTPGAYTAQAEQATAAGLVGKSAPVSFTVQAPSGETATIAAAGDIADCGGTDDEATANLLDGISGTVMTLGDNAYVNGTASNYACYNSSWGRHKARTHPIPGDHDYGVPDAGGYFDYFGAAAGPRPSGFYSYNVGAWHVVALNSGCYVQLRTCNDAQDEWLENDLEQNSSTCTLAQLHEPRFSSGEVHGNVGSVEPLWEILYEHGADVVLSGSEHMYERFGPQTAEGQADAVNGIRQFTVGTGGESHYQVGDIQPNSQVRESNTFGVLKMTLRPTGYDWQFVPVAGKTFTDSGTGSCH
jgi:hypothetical protein